MKEEVKTLPLFFGLSQQGLDLLAKPGSFSLISCDKGQLLHGEGDTCTALEVVLSGYLGVERIGENGELMTIATFGRGDLIGGNLLFSRDPVYRLSVTVKSDARLLRLYKDTLLALLQADQGFLLRYLSEVSDNAGLLEGKLKYVANLPLRQRILHFISQQQGLQGTGRIVLPVSKKALAAQLGTQRSSLSRCLTQMKNEGLLDYDRHSITLMTQTKAN